MATVPLPPMIVLLKSRVLPAKPWDYWVMLPSLLHVLAVLLPPTLVRHQLISNPGAPLVHLPFAAAQFISTPLRFWRALRVPPRPA